MGSDMQLTPPVTEPPASVELVHKDALNLPNLITITRLILAFVLFTLIYIQDYWFTAATLFAIAASTDFLDGYIARKYGLVTTLGRIMDPFVDKIIICGAFVFLIEKDSGVNAWIVIIVIGREMFVTSLRGFLERLGLDFSANWSGKLKMITQCVAVMASILSLEPSFKTPGFILFRDVLIWTCAAVTLHSGWVYVQRAAVMLRPRAAE